MMDTGLLLAVGGLVATATNVWYTSRVGSRAADKAGVEEMKLQLAECRENHLRDKDEISYLKREIASLREGHLLLLERLVEKTLRTPHRKHLPHGGPLP